MAGLGTIFVELDLDTSRFTRGQQQLLRDATSTALNIEDNFKKLGIKSDAEFNLMRQKATNAFEMIASSGKASTSEIARAQTALKNTMDSIYTQQYGESFFSKITGSISGMAGAIGIATGAAAAWKAIDFAKSLTEAGMAAERLANAMAASLGGYKQAESAMSFLRDQSKALGTDLYTSAEAFQKLAASAKGTTLEGQKTRDIFTAITTAATALHLSNDQTSGALLAISQMMSKGTVQAEELRGQLGERLPGAFNIAARAMGVTTSELGKMLQQGQVVAADFLPKFARALNEDYAGAAANSAESTQAAVNRMKTSWEEAKRDIGEILLPAVTTAANKINALIQAIAPEHLSDANKIIALREKVENLKDRMTQPGMTWVLGDDLKRAESELTRLEYKVAGVTLKTGEWAAGIRGLHQAEAEIFSKGDSWKSYFKEQDAAFERSAKDVTDYYVNLDKDAEKASNDARKAAEKAAREAEKDAEKYKASLEKVGDQYAKLTMSAADYEKLQIWRAWEKEAAKMTDVALAARDLALNLVDVKHKYDNITSASAQMRYKIERETMKAGYDSDWFQGMPAANKRADAMLKEAEQKTDEWTKLSERAAQQIERAFSDFFFDSMSGKMTTFTQMWDSMMRTVYKITSDIMGQIVKEFLFGESTKGGGSLTGGVLGPAVTWLKDFFPSAQGNVFAGPGISAYENSIISRPTVFPFARGIGLMGEAGTEAIMPLTRMPSGDLGVKSVKGQQQTIVNNFTIMATDADSFNSRLVQSRDLIASIQRSARADNHASRRSR